MANMKDIAQKLGVSVSTISRALNGSEEISLAMRDKISLAAEELGYSLHGRGGRQAPDWNCAGIVVPELMSPYYANLVHAAKDYFAAKGYSSIVKLTDFQPAQMIEALGAMKRIRVKCLLIVMDTEEEMNERIMRAIHACKVPILMITAKYYASQQFDCIHLDEYSGILMGIQHLQSRGYQRIGCISDLLSGNRVTIFKQAMKLQNLALEPKMLAIGQQRFEIGGDLRMKELLSQKQPPDAVFCCYDQMAIGAIHAIEERGLRLGKDVAVLGYDNLSVSEFVGTGITTIANPCEQVLSIAVNILTDRVKNPQAARQQITLRPNLIIRGST